MRTEAVRCGLLGRGLLGRGLLGRGLWGALALLALPDVAFGYCRTTTCDPDVEPCVANGDGCLENGIPLYWPDLCVTFGVHENGSPLRGISYEKAEEATRKAFQTWISADCGSGNNPSVGVVSLGEVVCDQIEYNHDFPGDETHPPKVAGPNVNLVVFRDDNWIYGDAKTIALTTITFAVSTGEILDADIEVNSQDIELTTGNSVVRNDLQSVMTHEVGHFFGLAHSRVPGASMNPDYDEGNVEFRTLSEDDRDGICAIYGPLIGDEPEPVATPADDAPAGGAGSMPVEEEEEGLDCTGEGPRFGFSRYCGDDSLADGCSITPGKARPLEGTLAAVEPKRLRPEASPRAHAAAKAEAARETAARRVGWGSLLGIALPAIVLGAAVAWRRRAALKR